MNTGLENLPAKTMNAIAPRLVMAEIMLQPNRWPVARTTGVWPIGAKLVPATWSLRSPISSPQ